MKIRFVLNRKKNDSSFVVIKNIFLCWVTVMVLKSEIILDSDKIIREFLNLFFVLNDEFFICTTVKEATDTKMIVTLCIIVKRIS